MNVLVLPANKLQTKYEIASDGTSIIIARAKKGTLPTSPNWQLKKLTSELESEPTFPNGNSDFAFQLSLMDTYAYSPLI